MVLGNGLQAGLGAQVVVALGLLDALVEAAA